MVFYFLAQDVEYTSEKGYHLKSGGLVKYNDVMHVKEKCIPLNRQYCNTEGLRECDDLEFVGFDLHHIPPKIINKTRNEVLNELLDAE